jgi:hypothetical protein
MSEQQAYIVFRGTLDGLEAVCRLLNLSGDGVPCYVIQRKKGADTNSAQVCFHPLDDECKTWLGTITVSVEKPEGPLHLAVHAHPWEWAQLEPDWQRLAAQINEYNSRAISPTANNNGYAILSVAAGPGWQDWPVTDVNPITAASTLTNPATGQRVVAIPQGGSAGTPAELEAPKTSQARSEQKKKGAWAQKQADVWERIYIRGWQNLKAEVIAKKLKAEEQNKTIEDRCWIPRARKVAEIVRAGKRGEYKIRPTN